MSSLAHSASGAYISTFSLLRGARTSAHAARPAGLLLGFTAGLLFGAAVIGRQLAIAVGAAHAFAFGHGWLLVR